jgi:hypothetical protein
MPIMPVVIWSATVFLPVAYWLVRKVSLEMYVSYRWTRKLYAMEFWKMIGGGESVGNIEAGGEAVEGGDIQGINKETPLRRAGRGQNYMINVLLMNRLGSNSRIYVEAQGNLKYRFSIHTNSMSYAS